MKDTELRRALEAAQLVSGAVGRNAILRSWGEREAAMRVEALREVMRLPLAERMEALQNAQKASEHRRRAAGLTRNEEAEAVRLASRRAA